MIDFFNPANILKCFADQHGGTYVQKDGWLLFPDGAMVENSRYGSMVQPPKIEYERLKLVARYYEILVERATEQFETKKQKAVDVGLIAVRHGLPGVSQAMVDELKELKKIVRARQRELAKVKKQLDDISPAAHVQNAILDAQLRNAHQKRLAEVHQLKI